MKSSAVDSWSHLLIGEDGLLVVDLVHTPDHVQEERLQSELGVLVRLHVRGYTCCSHYCRWGCLGRT